MWSPRTTSTIILLVIRIPCACALRAIIVWLIAARISLGLCDVGEVGSLDATAAIEGEEGDEEDTGDN